MKKKPTRHAEKLETRYDELHWRQLDTLRSEAIRIMGILENAHLASITHGSTARGDISKSSDIDVFLPTIPSSFIVETALERAKIRINRRVLVQATPHYAAKGYVEIGERKTVSFPLMKMRRVERDFYRFGGELGLAMLKKQQRVMGVNKQLMLIEPTRQGHVERSIIGQEEEIAKLLGISVETVFDRVHALRRRDEIGRTGVFIEREVRLNETFEMALKKLVETKPEVRRRFHLHKN